MGKDILLKCKSIKKAYGDTQAVRETSFELECGNIYALLGPNGSGKTTTMKMIAGLAIPDGGAITLDGIPVGLKTKDMVSYMPTEQYYYEFLTVRGVGKYFNDFYKDFDRDRFKELLELFEIKSSVRVTELSSGKMATLKFAAAISRKARLFMLDEPLNGADLIARDDIISVIKETIRDDNCILMSTHLVEELQDTVDHAFFIKRGQIVRQGRKAETFSKAGQTLSDVYRSIFGHQRKGG